MKETPIIFSTEMVRAILDGRKTQMRKTKGLEAINDNPEIWSFLEQIEDEYHFGHGDPSGDAWGEGFVKCPYGKVGDLLWVRETCSWPKPFRGETTITYKATFDKEEAPYLRRSKRQWRPAIYMPKWAARIWLEITGIKVEKVQGIGVEDEFAEGRPVPLDTEENGRQFDSWFKELWDSLNAKRGYGWDKNPFVWVIEFRRKVRGKG